jgi:hypothetical protein
VYQGSQPIGSRCRGKANVRYRLNRANADYRVAKKSLIGTPSNLLGTWRYRHFMPRACGQSGKNQLSASARYSHVINGWRQQSRTQSKK